MKKKFNFFKIEEVVETCTHMYFYAIIKINDNIINLERVDCQNIDLYIKSVEEVKRKYNDMYQTLLDYRDKYKLETMSISLDFDTTCCTDNLPI